MTDAISAEQYRELMAEEEKKKRPKYNNVKTEVDGHVFDSRREAERYVELRQLEAAGEIADLELQPRFPLLVEGQKIATYVADFEYWDHAKGERVWEDVKGVRTPLYKLKKRHVEAQYNIKIREV